MAQNRLHLDFSLSTSEERSKFLEQYLKTLGFAPTEEELETMGNYVLWGKDSDGKNLVQKKQIQIQTRNRTWDQKELESLDELQESPTFNEATLNPVSQFQARPKIVREVFDRQKALEKAPEFLQQELKDLFSTIDFYDLMTEFYDLEHGKRTKPIRDSLLSRFTQEEIEDIRTRAADLNQYRYLKLRHLLVDLRQQQYCISDNFTKQLVKHDYSLNILSSDARFDADIPVYPLGLKYEENNLVFLQENELCGRPYSGKILREISNIINSHSQWDSNTFFFDFTNTDHVYNLLLSYEELTCAADLDEPDETITALLDTIDFYIDFAELSEIQKEILDMKIKKVKNPDIAGYINKKYKKNYTANYISTIFKQKIVKQINEAAEYHLKIVENLFYPENFKECNCCGNTYLIDPRNFVRKTRAKDGFANRCKKCDRDDRERRKER